MSSQVDQIKSKIDIVSVVSAYVKLEKAGSNFKGRCPFHNEKTPSFFVSPDRGSYYCFGCQAKGDIFTFVQEFEGLDFVGALKVLAEKAGVPLDDFSKENKSEKDKLFTIMEQTTLFYQKKLTDNKNANDYLSKRGVKEETVSEFRIGFAPDGWRELFQYLSSKGVTAGEMLSCGLIKKMDGMTDSFYDTFRGRIMFPIADSSGRVVGFSGRILVPDEKAPKYLNSPETVLFNKSEILFGLDKAKKDIRLKDYSILVEGQMDLVMMHQIGIKNTVASSGTALTQEHLIKLRRLSNRIIMSYDGDSAGFSASNRSSKIALALGMELKIAQMPNSMDPADLAKDDQTALIDALKNSKHIIDFYTDNLLQRKISGRELGEEIRKNVLPYIAELTSSIEKSHFIKSIAQKTFIKEEALWDDLKMVSVGEISVSRQGSPPHKTGKVEAIERRVIGLLWWQKGNKSVLSSVDGIDIEKRVREILGQRIDEIEDRLKIERETLLFETESYYNNRDNTKREIEELLLALEEEYLKKQFSIAMTELQKSEQIKDSSKVLSFLEECQRLSQKINSIKMIRSSYEK
jgi:DNA primase